MLIHSHRLRFRNHEGVPVRDASLPSWDQVRLFLALMRARSLAGAGKRIDLDASNVSRGLARLEAALGVHLFDRTRDGLVPTSAAEDLLVHAEEIELGVARFAAASAQTEATVEGVVRLTAPPGVADRFIAPLLPELCALHPGLSIDLDASVRYADLTRREADIALRTVRPHGGDLMVTRVVATRELPMAAKAYAREVGVIGALTDARWIGWSDELAHLPGPQGLKRSAPGLVPVLRSNHVPSVLAAAHAGLGIAVLPEPYLLTGLVPIAHQSALAPLWATLPATELWLVAHRALRNVPRVATVWEFLLTNLRDPPPGGEPSPSRGAVAAP